MTKQFYFLTTWILYTILLHEINAQAEYGRFFGIQGKFCESREGKCCPGRDDDCHTPILDHLCYCDDFCDGDELIFRNDHDCCPDFHGFCKGIAPSPPENVTQGCEYDGVTYPIGASRKENCNICTCEVGGIGQLSFRCESKECMINSEMIQIVNGGNYGWRASNYSEFWGRDLNEGMTYRLGTLFPEEAVRNLRPVHQIYEPDEIPKSFDSRTKNEWGNYIQGISDQGWCGSDWALTTASITADRLAIQSEGVEIVKLSAQQLLSCDSRGQLGCEGGNLDRTWNFMRSFGIVDEDCFPYTSGLTGEAGRCQISRSITNLKSCETSVVYSGRTSTYKSGPAYRISTDESDIKYEIMKFGPVQGVMEVTGDFFMYKSGVYKKTNLRPSGRVGYHSVRIVGWGEDYDRGEVVKYWTIANTWGTGWGEKGYFRILRGNNECEIENFVIASWARTADERNFEKIRN